MRVCKKNVTQNIRFLTLDITDSLIDEDQTLVKAYAPPCCADVMSSASAYSSLLLLLDDISACTLGLAEIGTKTSKIIKTFQDSCIPM